MLGANMNEADERKFIRHPSDIPLEYCFVDKPLCISDSINNVSIGGLSFSATQAIAVDSWLHLHIPINDEHFEVDAQVRWCHKRGDGLYDIGVHFPDQLEAFSARMVEQVCHIEHYKKEVLEKEGRALSGDEAAAEWIEKFAPQFPQSH